MQNDTFTTPTMSTALCGNYTIDQGSASSSTNFTSFSSAAAKLAISGVSCATTFTVVGTTPYTEQADFNTVPGLSATNTVTITGGTGNAANRIIQFAGTASLPYTIRIANSNYISIKNLTIRGTSGNAWPLQFMGVCANDTVQNCIIDFNGAASSSFSSTNYMGIVMNGNANTYTNPGAFANIVIDSNTIPGVMQILCVTLETVLQQGVMCFLVILVPMLTNTEFIFLVLMAEQSIKIELPCMRVALLLGWVFH